ncbi:hypothetical protein [Algoriphagus yeomjeoni]|uniref:Uncharacterized protein n=1 Tax=Algoriphagus yeomjeoni TaxID=291403 RepID=A0A327P379_9BACT|nr:hypothetical protein [Algoriphagus yeomjeoni]RAI86755.1 hypothetical protein LV83_03312 [Algoriphagus yeomjeoni]
MKLTKETASDLDLLIKELVADNSKVASIEDMKSVLFPDKPEAYLMALFHHLKSHSPSLFFPEPEPSPELFLASDYLPAFYYEGSFTAIFESQEKERLETEEKKKLELEKLKFDVKNTKRIYKTYWWTFVFALISFVYVLIRLGTWLLEERTIE